MNISIIGGDLRSVRLVENYAAEGNTIYTFGLENYNWKENTTSSSEEKNSEIVLCENLSEAMEKSNIVIGGIPFSRDGIKLNAPFARKEILIEDFKKNLNGKKFFAGRILEENFCPEENASEDKPKIQMYDLLKDDELTILNAIPTVEGAIKIAIDEREETIHESNVLVCGYGRIGKIACDRFSKLGANVYCTARKETDLAWIREKRFIPLTYPEVINFASRFDIVINTVPTLIIKKEELDAFNKDVLLIELASLPGGFDKEYIKQKGLKLITAPGIPGKEMPKTAAKYIKKVIDKILDTA